MTPDRWQHVEGLFHSALEHPPETREAFLLQVCEDDALRGEVLSLIAQQDSGSFLSHPDVNGLVSDVMRDQDPLPQGHPLGHYVIERLIDAGGMGEVYRAHDASLGRDVAIKILPPVWLGDANRRARFEREARLLASLNHPHIAAIHGLVQHDGIQGLVLELVEGPTLAKRLEQATLPLDDALAIATQLASALEATHERGIIHRDLKPTNIALQPDPLAPAHSVVKVLDFGIALVTPGEHAAPAEERTRPGAVLGTASYMSPEQARGQIVDKKTDIWAFGCVLYEMLSGRQAFHRETRADTHAAILEQDPDWSRLPDDTPESVRGLLRRCLRKDTRRRLHDIADARIELEDAVAASRTVRPASSAVQSATPRRTPIRPAFTVLAVAVAVLVIAIVWGGLGWRTVSARPARVVPVAVKPGDESFASASPDGKDVVFTWKTNEPDAEGIYLLHIGDESPVRLTFGGSADLYPVWAPDGDRIAFIRRERGHDGLYQISKFGGAEKKIAELGAMDLPPVIDCFYNPLLAWSPDGHWMAVGGHRVDADAGMLLVNVADGTTRPLPTRSTAAAYYSSPAFSPTGDAIAYAGCRDVGAHQCRVGTAELDATQSVTRQRWLTTEFEVVNGTAWAPDGASVIYGAASAWLNTFHLWRVSRGAGPPERLDVAGIATLPSISARTGRMVFSRRAFDLGIWSLRHGEPRHSLVSSTFSEYEATFSPDGSKLAFVTDRSGEGSELWTADSDGTGLKRLTPGVQRSLGSPRWSPDGNWLAYDGKWADGKYHVSVIEAAGGASRRLVLGSFGENLPSWSHDAKWIYFASNNEGSFDVWKAPTAGGQPERVTRDGGFAPLWSPGGETLYFARDRPDGGRALFSMPASGGPPTKLLDSIAAWAYWPTRRGIYYAVQPMQPPPANRYEIRLLDPRTGSSKLIDTVTMVFFKGLSATDDTVLISGVESVNVDLMMIEHFK